LGGRARVWYYDGTDGVIFVVYRQGMVPGYIHGHGHVSRGIFWSGMMSCCVGMESG
jgi:hypothetical protein